MSSRGIGSEENLKEFSGMIALTAGSENKAGQDTVSSQAGGRAGTEDNLSKNNNASERLFRLVIGWRDIGMPEKSKELINLFSDQLRSESFGRREVQLIGTARLEVFEKLLFDRRGLFNGNKPGRNFPSHFTGP